MKLKFISENGELLGLAMHLSSDGHNVQFRIAHPTDAGHGITEPWVQDDPFDVIVFDSPAFGREAEEIQASGLHVFGASRWASLLDRDAEYQKDIIRSLGWPKDEIEQSVNISLVCWFNGVDFLSVYPCLRYNRLMPNGKGPEVGASGAIGYFGKTSKRVEETILSPLRAMLRKVGFRGMMTVDVGVNKDHLTVRKLSPRPTTALGALLYENTTASPSSVFLSLFEPTPRKVVPLDTWSVSLLVSVPPFPNLTKTAIIPIDDLHPKALKHIWPIDMARDGAHWTSGGMSGKLMYITARGEYINEAVKRVYRTAGNLRIPDVQYRDDIGENAQQLFRSVEEWSWLN